MNMHPSSSMARCYRQLQMELRQMLRTPAFSWSTLLFPAVFYALFALGMKPMGAGRSAVYLLSTYVIFFQHRAGSVRHGHAARDRTRTRLA